MNLFVTGATGIAAAATRLATAAGHRVFVASLSPGDCAQLARETACSWRAGDLTDPEFVDSAFDSAIGSLGRVDGVFHVAGGSGRRFGDGPLHVCTDDGWRSTLALNLDTTFFVARAALRRMREQPVDANGLRGALVLTGSVLASHPEPENFATHAYAASKGAIESLTKTLASHYASEQIRVNAVAPGLTKTPMSRRAQSDSTILDFLKHQQPLAPEMVRPESVARLALFLLSADACEITGQIVAADGGWSVR